MSSNTIINKKFKDYNFKQDSVLCLNYRYLRYTKPKSQN